MLETSKEKYIFENMKLNIAWVGEILDIHTNNFNKWVSVKDKLPDRGKRVLGYASTHASTCRLDASYFECHQYNGLWQEEVDLCIIDVTHWMELPEPPVKDMV